MENKLQKDEDNKKLLRQRLAKLHVNELKKDI